LHYSMILNGELMDKLKANMDPLLNPKSVAVIGASENSGSPWSIFLPRRGLPGPW
jgi:hypothetical protein